MDDSLHNESLLIRYLDGELSADEKALLEQRLQTDTELQQQLTDLRVAVQAVKQYGLSQKIGAIHTGMMQELKGPKPQAKVVPFRRKFRYLVAVAASVLIVLIGVSLYLSSQVSSEKLYEQAFVDFPVSASRGEGNQLSAIENHYQQKDYEAIVNGSRSLHMDAKDSLLTGLAYLHTGRAEQGISFFERIAAYGNTFQQDGEFYLALSYLKNPDYGDALPLFEKIAGNPSHLYHSRVTQNFLEDLKSLREK
jgi:hypothetical protein